MSGCFLVGRLEQPAERSLVSNFDASKANFEEEEIERAEKPLMEDHLGSDVERPR